MRMISSAIVVLAGSILIATGWLSNAPDSEDLALTIMAGWVLVGVGVLAWAGLLLRGTDRPNQSLQLTGTARDR